MIYKLKRGTYEITLIGIFIAFIKKVYHSEYAIHLLNLPVEGDW